jgi:multidrug efflux pump subunit AcrA (membrane-fusion protein)
MNIKFINKKSYLAIIAIAVAATAIGGWYMITPHNAGANYVFVGVKKGDLTQEIKASGSVKAAQELNLAFENSGKLKTANVKVGDQVKAGQILAELDDSSIQADLMQSDASIQAAQSQLKTLDAALELQKIKKQDLEIGARPEDLQVSQAGIDNATKTLNDAKTNLDNVKTKTNTDLNTSISNIGNLLQGIYASAFGTVNHLKGVMFANDLQNPKLMFVTALDSQASVTAEQEFVASGKAVDDLSSINNKLNPDNSNYIELSNEAINQLQIIREFLLSMNTALDAVVPSTDLPQTQVNAYKIEISDALARTNGDITNLKNFQDSITVLNTTNQSLIFSAQAKVDDANNGLLTAQSAYNQKKAGATKQQLDGQDQIINQAAASIETQMAQIRVAEASSDKN